MGNGRSSAPGQIVLGVLDYVWRDGKPKLKRSKYIEGDILIRDKNGQLVALEKIDFDQAKRVLGVYSHGT